MAEFIRPRASIYKEVRMSRSRRKTPISGWACSASNKVFKKNEHRRERRLVNVLLHIGEETMPHHKKFGNEWDSPRDGKMWFGNYNYAATPFLSWEPVRTYEEQRQEFLDDYKRWMRK